MPVESAGDLIDALATGEFDRVLGTPESHWVDFKRDPYQLDTPKGQWELAKDVAAMAEVRGGLMVIGYGTEKLVNEGVEIAKDHHPVPKEHIVPEQYRDVVAGRVYPHIEQLVTHWYPPGADASKGVFVIEVPPQQEAAKPFLVTRVLDDTGTEVAHGIGFPSRDGDRVAWKSAETIHHEINLGRRFRLLSALSHEPHAPSEDEEAGEIDAVVKAADAGGEAWVAYQAVATAGTEFGDPAQLERIRAVLVDPPSLRSSGFNFRNASPPQWVSDSVIELDGRATLRLSSIGLFTVCLPATRECLGWALNDNHDSDAPLRMNPLTLTEYTLEYFRLLDDHVRPTFGVESWDMQVIASGMQTHAVVLDPGPLGDGIKVSPPLTQHLGKLNEWRATFKATGVSGQDAFLALTQLYPLFGLSEEDVPYASDGMIVESQIASA